MVAKGNLNLLEWLAGTGFRNSARERSYALVAGPFQTLPWLIARPLLCHFDPIWHRVTVTPGQANHSYYKDPSSLCRNSIRPREILDFTVPMLICSVAAISS